MGAPDEKPGSDPDHPKSKQKQDRDLDRELEDSFPASDPPSASQPTGAVPAGDPKTKP